MIPLIVCVVLCLGVGSLGAVATSSSVQTWYATIAKPTWTPPGWIFGPVWTLLYILMGVALWMIWQLPPSPIRTQGLVFFGVQLVLNGAWSFLFFGMQNPLFGLIGIVALDVAVIATLWRFSAVKPLAAGLLVPYLAWILFASGLNYAIFRLNP